MTMLVIVRENVNLSIGNKSNTSSSNNYNGSIATKSNGDS